MCQPVHIVQQVCIVALFHEQNIRVLQLLLVFHNQYNHMYHMQVLQLLVQVVQGLVLVV